MNTKHITGGALIGLVLAGGLTGMVSAQSAADATNLTEEQVIEIALMEVAGDVTEVDLEQRRGGAVYEVEVTAEDGSEMEVLIAADSGDVLKVKADGEGCDKGDRGEDA